MGMKYEKYVSLFCLTQLLILGASVSFAQKKARPVNFKKHVVTTEFIAEGAAIGDVNKDGKKDILSGAYWFEAPSWTKHEIMPPKEFHGKMDIAILS